MPVCGGAARSLERLRVCVALGTRPEAVKLAPVFRALERRAGEFEPILVATSQHCELLAQALSAFGLAPAVDLRLAEANRSLAEFTGAALAAMARVLRDMAPDLLLVQGDTSTVVAASLAAFYEGIPVGHVEAGLRSHDLRHPFPEEANRRLASCVAAIHFAPTERARENLLKEGVDPADAHVTGNTVVDAVRSLAPRDSFDDRALAGIEWGGPGVVLATVHRRENHGPNLCAICGALRALAERENARIVLPVHGNPAVRETVLAELAGCEGILLLEPLTYQDLTEVLRRCRFVLTDSGGLQEEAAALGKPVLILRTVTERPEVVEEGFGKLVGADGEQILSEATVLLRDESVLRAMSSGRNPFGDGHAAERIADLLAETFTPRPRESQAGR